MVRASIATLSLAVVLVATLGGCQRPASSTAPKVSPATPVQLIRADRAKLDEIIASHRGQVVLVDFWATWCEPCVADFPHTVALAKKYRRQGLATISVSLDLLKDEPRVSGFLAQQGAEFENLISQHDAIGQKLFEDFDLSQPPEYRLYDRQGKLSQTWTGKSDGLEDKIKELLAAPADSQRPAAAPIYKP